MGSNGRIEHNSTFPLRLQTRQLLCLAVFRNKGPRQIDRGRGPRADVNPRSIVNQRRQRPAMPESAEMAENSKLAEKRPDNTIPFRAALSNIFGDIGEAVSEQDFAECQSFLRSKLSGAKFDSIIHKLHSTIGKDLQGRMNQEVEAMVSEESLVEGLEKIRVLVENSQNDANHVAWRPPGDVELHQRTVDMAKINDAINHLTEIVADLETENNFYVQEITKKRQAAFSLDKNVAKTRKVGVNSISKLESTRGRLESYADELDKKNHSEQDFCQ